MPDHPLPSEPDLAALRTLDQHCAGCGNALHHECEHTEIGCQRCMCSEFVPWPALAAANPRPDVGLREALDELAAVAMLPVYLPPKPEDEDDRYLLRGAVLELVDRARRALADPEPAREDGEAWDEADGMCPNCITPWKCNGPHLSDETVAARRATAPSPADPEEER